MNSNVEMIAQKWRRRDTLAVLSIGWLIGLPLLGCGTNEHPELRRVSGTVTYNGEVVADATVAFYNDASARLATGRTNAEGRFDLTSYESGDGAVPGEHRVVVTKTEAAEEEEPKLSMDEAMTARRPKDRARQLLPTRYASDRTTPLVVTVAEEGPNDLVLELVDK